MRPAYALQSNVGNNQKMHMRGIRLTPAVIVVAISAATALCPATTTAQPANLNAIHLSDDIVPAPNGFEPAAGKYVTRKATDLYISPFVWAGKVVGVHLNAGQPVETLAKLRGYDWLLVGNKGEGIGYVPMSMLVPAR
jgi:hypothetical protein